jgi:hypothetical protein
VVQKVESIIDDAKQLMQDIRVIDFTDAA